MERMMKAQEVILKAAAGKLKWWEAAEIMGVTDRTMRRWHERLNEHGCSGMRDAERVQRTSLPCRFHPAVRALGLEVQHQLPPPGGDDARAQLRRSSHNHLSLDPNVRP